LEVGEREMLRVVVNVVQYDVDSMTSRLCTTGPPDGTKNVARKEPFASVVMELGEVARMVPSHLTVMALAARKP